MILEPVQTVPGGYHFYCPGCNEPHYIQLKGEYQGDGLAWDFSGTHECPTFSPSYKAWRDDYVCHFFVRGGKIQYCGDSTHELAGKTVDMVEYPDNWK